MVVGILVVVKGLVMVMVLVVMVMVVVVMVLVVLVLVVLVMMLVMVLVVLVMVESGLCVNIDKFRTFIYVSHGHTLGFIVQDLTKMKGKS